jgi:hypothetical protein
MAKISQAAKDQYDERVREYKDHADRLIAREQEVLAEIEKNPSGAEYKKVKLSNELLNLASLYLLMNRLYLSLLGVKKPELLDEARRSCYRSVIYLEQVVSNVIDGAFSDYSDRLEAIKALPDEQRYRLAQKMGFTIQSVREDLGDNAKWRWGFVELEGRFATVTKNLMNLKTMIAGLDPRVPGYEARLEHLQFVKDLLKTSAERYREKFELVSTRIDDFKQAIAFLSALKRIHTVIGETAQADELKRKIDVWRSRMASFED